MLRKRDVNQTYGQKSRRVVTYVHESAEILKKSVKDPRFSCQTCTSSKGTHRRSSTKRALSWDFPGGPLQSFCFPNSEDLGLLPGQGTRSHMS